MSPRFPLTFPTPLLRCKSSSIFSLPLTSIMNGAHQKLSSSPSVFVEHRLSSISLSEGGEPRLDHFTRWRPLNHLIAPKNWMNDPCGPCFDPSTGLYHILYQYNPTGATWANMTWLHATSKNLIHWEHVSAEPRLIPSVPHDQEGIFSGCMLLHGPQGEKGMMTAIYTAISKLPIHFTKPYNWGSEKLAYATSINGGKTWERDSNSIILAGPPDEFKGNIVAWRDPFISLWPEMDIQLGLKQGEQLYGLISGGLKDKTPTAFLYRMDPDNVKKWTYVAKVADLGLNFQLGKQSGDMGRNWEVCNFFSLQDQQFLIMNVEGVGREYKERYAMWANVELNGPKLTPVKSGMVDYGCLYAATTFLHGPTQRRLLWGWITEDDLAKSRYDQQGWSGCMSLPREMFMLTYKGIDKSVAVDEDLKHTFQMEEEKGKPSLKLQTLGSRPAEEALALRQGADHFIVQQPTPGPLPVQSKSFELEVDITVVGKQADIGLLICHNESHSRYTKIVYTGNAVHVVRSNSSKDPDVTTKDLVAPLKLLPYANGSLEKIQIRLFLDNSVLELFVNNRVAFATRIYCDQQDCDSVTLINTNPSHAHFDMVQGWVGLQHAMRNCPFSITPAQTINK